MLERVRRRLRLLVRLIDKAQRKIVYSDFQDEMGDETVVVLPGVNESKDFDNFRTKARAFLRAHRDHVAIAKLRANKALTPVDLTELELRVAVHRFGPARSGLFSSAQVVDLMTVLARVRQSAAA